MLPGGVESALGQELEQVEGRRRRVWWMEKQMYRQLESQGQGLVLWYLVELGGGNDKAGSSQACAELSYGRGRL